MTEPLYKGTGGHNYIQDEDNDVITHQNHIEESARFYRIWSLMKGRCNPNTTSPKAQKYYVAKGIKVCKKWMKLILTQVLTLHKICQ